MFINMIMERLLTLPPFLLDLSTRESVTSEPVHVINITVKDNHEEAIIGSMQVYDFLMMVKRRPNLFVLRYKLSLVAIHVNDLMIRATHYKIEFNIPNGILFNNSY